MGFSTGGHSKQSQTSRVTFPSPFIDLMESRYGRGFGVNEVLAGLPQTPSWLGGAPSGYASQLTGGAAGQGTGGGGGGTIPFNTVSQVIASQFPNDQRKAQNLSDSILTELRRQGIDPNQGITLDQLRSLGTSAPRQGSTLAGGGRQFIQGTLPGLLEGFLPQPNRLTPQGGPDVSQLGIPQRINELFAPKADFSPYQFNQIPGITAPVATAQQMNVAPQGFQNYENALYRSLYDPQQRAINEQGAIADRQLMAQLAQSGLSSSGTGIGQVQQARLDRQRDLQNRASDAAYQATTQRFGAEFAQQQFNAKQRQDTALANAGFNLEAQKTNAANVLAGDVARSDNYLKTMGLNVEQATAMRKDFLAMVGLTQSELERIDKSNLDKLGLLLNNWLQQGALLGNLGQVGTSQGTSRGGIGGGLSITGGTAGSA